LTVASISADAELRGAYFGRPFYRLPGVPPPCDIRPRRHGHPDDTEGDACQHIADEMDAEHDARQRDGAHDQCGSDGSSDAAAPSKEAQGDQQQQVVAPSAWPEGNDKPGAAETGSGNAGRARPTISFNAKPRPAPPKTVTTSHVAWCRSPRIRYTNATNASTTRNTFGSKASLTASAARTNFG